MRPKNGGAHRWYLVYGVGHGNLVVLVLLQVSYGNDFWTNFVLVRFSLVLVLSDLKVHCDTQDPRNVSFLFFYFTVQEAMSGFSVLRFTRSSRLETLSPAI